MKLYSPVSADICREVLFEEFSSLVRDFDRELQRFTHDSVVTYAHVKLLLREARGDTEPWPNQMTMIMMLGRCGIPALCSTKVFIKSTNILQALFNRVFSLTICD